LLDKVTGALDAFHCGDEAGHETSLCC
jgi:hypothetical protein